MELCTYILYVWVPRGGSQPDSRKTIQCKSQDASHRVWDHWLHVVFLFTFFVFTFSM